MNHDKNEYGGCGLTVVGVLLQYGYGGCPNPTVIGPIPATPGDPSHNYPFFSTTVDLAAYGYVEEEFFLEGTANRYSTPTMPPATGSIIDSGHPYRTRIVVRRPVSPDDFNGTVLMEWQNVTAGYDIDALWDISHDHFIRRGYAWVGVSAQQAGIHTAVTGLKAWSPKRYGKLDVTQGGTIVDDALSYDIFSQAAQAVRSPVGVDPIGGLDVQRVWRSARQCPPLASSRTTTPSTRWPVSSTPSCPVWVVDCSVSISTPRDSNS